MIHIRSAREIDKFSKACQIVKETLEMVEEWVQPGITTLELDNKAEEFIRSKGVEPGFKGLYGYPATLCVSIDDEVVHGLPTKRELKEGEILSVDVGSLMDGFYGDHAKTFCVGNVNNKAKNLVEFTNIALNIGINEAKLGNNIGDIGFAIQNYAESKGYSVVKELVGHGIGSNLHEEPQVPNYGTPGTGPIIEEGMCIAIEPMINYGKPDIFVKDDKWTVCTKDGKISAHFEHSIAITKKGTKILTN